MAQSLRNTLITRLFLITTCVSLFIGLIFYVYSVRSAEEEFQTALRAEVDQLTSIFTQQLWLFDLRTTEQLVENAFNNPNVSWIRLRDQENNIVAEKGLRQEAHVTIEQINLIHESGVVVGNMDIAYTDLNKDQKKRLIFEISILTVLATLIVTIAFIIYTLNKHLVLPLKRLQEDMSQVANGEFKQSHLIDQKNEIQSIINVFNQMAHSLSQREEEQKRLEGEICESEKIKKSLLDHSPVCHKIIDLDFNLQYMNMNGFNIMRLNPHDNIYGKPYPFEFFPKDHQSELIDALRQVKEKSEKVYVEGETCDVEGNKVWLNHTLIPVSNDDGDLDFITVVSADITKRKKMENIQLQSNQLSALGEIAAGVAHEINNPINGIINYAQLLLNKDPEDNFSKNVLEKITKEGQRVAAIVKHLLGMARRDSETKESISPNGLLEEPLNLLAQMLKHEGIHIDVHLKDDLPNVYCNPRQVEQVILNLLSNARYALNEKYAKENPNKYIIIEALPAAEQNQLQLIIQDFGSGIPEDKLERVFEPFYTTKKAGVGTGIGLSISKDIMQQNGGELTIESKIGEYTKVILTLPTTQV